MIKGNQPGLRNPVSPIRGFRRLAVFFFMCIFFLFFFSVFYWEYGVVPFRYRGREDELGYVEVGCLFFYVQACVHARVFVCVLSCVTVTW